jgi:hypothetical protein
MFAMDKECFKYLRPIIFSSQYKTTTLYETVVEKEIKMSQMVLEKGWNISCTAKKYQNIDYRKVKNNINISANGKYGDPHFQGTYFGNTVDPFEIIFIKTNRGISLPN